MSKYYTPKLGHLWRRAKRRDRSEGAASGVRRIDPATYQPSEAVREAMQRGSINARKNPFGEGDEFVVLDEDERQRGSFRRQRLIIKGVAGPWERY